MSEPTESVAEPFPAWEHLHASSPPELRRWLTTGKPVALHADLLMVAVPNIFTRNQLEVRFRSTIETSLAGFYGRPVQLAVIVDETLVPAEDTEDLDQGFDHDRLDQLGPPQRPRFLRVGRTRWIARPRRPGRGGSARSGRRPAGSEQLSRSRPVPAAPGGRRPAQPEVHLRDLRHRQLEPLRSRRRHRGRREPGQVVQPADHLRRFRTGQDPPAARPRALRPQLFRPGPGALCVHRGTDQRLHQRDQPEQGRRIPATLSRRRRAADRRHPVPGGQGADPGGVLPHVQHAAQCAEADRDDLRPAAETAGESRTAPAQPVRLGPDHRRAAARPGDPDRDSAQEGRARNGWSPDRRCWSSSPAGSRPIFASSRVR